MKNPEEWFHENIEIMMSLYEPIYDKYVDKSIEIKKEQDKMFQNCCKSFVTEDYPVYYEFCRDAFVVFKKLWEHFSRDRENLCRIYYHRVVVVGWYNSKIALDIESGVIYPIIELLANASDGSYQNRWILENVVTDKEFLSIYYDRKSKLNYINGIT